MKILDIAAKDLLRSYRSAFLLTMMFIAPLVITGIIYAAFGGVLNGQGSFNLPVTRIVIANLDQPDAQAGLAAGRMLADYLGGPDLAAIVSARTVPDEASARAAVDRREADVAITIPQNFSAAVATPGVSAAVRLYQDPTLSLGPGVVKTLVSQFIDGFAGAKIAVQVTNHQAAAYGKQLSEQESRGVADRYVAWVQSSSTAARGDAVNTFVDSRPPASAPTTGDAQTRFLGPVMAGLLILFVFFTGAASAQSIIAEDEEGTLSRLFTTPTSRAVIFGGKLTGTLAALVLQVLVLLLVSSILFQIKWGNPVTLLLNITGLVIAASGFGLMVMSFVKTTRQAGPILGAVVTLTGILGGLIPTGDPSQPSPFETISLVLPQGWAMHAWRLALTGANASDVLLPFAVLLLWGALFFAIGTVSFQRRFE